MNHLIYLLFLLFVFSSCRNVQYIPMKSTRTEYKTRDVIHYDSIFQKDSVYIHTKSDTIYKTEIKYRCRYLTVNKCDTVLLKDSVLIPYPVEKHLTKWQAIKIELGGWAFGVIIVVVVIFFLWLLRK